MFLSFGKLDVSEMMGEFGGEITVKPARTRNRPRRVTSSVAQLSPSVFPRIDRYRKLSDNRFSVRGCVRTSGARNECRYSWGRDKERHSIK